METSKQKGFIIPFVIAIIAVLAIGGGVYVYNEQKEKDAKEDLVSTEATTAEFFTASSTLSRSDWKTYLSEKYGFEFKYPSSFTVTDYQQHELDADNPVIMRSYQHDGLHLGGVDIYVYPLEKELKNTETEHIFISGNDQIFVAASDKELLNLIVPTFKFINTQPRASSSSESSNIQIVSSVSNDLTFAISGTMLSVLSNGKVIQSLSVEEYGLDALDVVPNATKFLTSLDVNFDGNVDIGVYSGTGYAGVDQFYDFYIYNPQSEKFEKDTLLVEISNPTIDPKNKVLESHFRSGPDWYTQKFTYNGKIFSKGPAISDTTGKEEVE